MTTVPQTISLIAPADRHLPGTPKGFLKLENIVVQVVQIELPRNLKLLRLFAKLLRMGKPFFHHRRRVFSLCGHPFILLIYHLLPQIILIFTPQHYKQFSYIYS